MVKWVSRWCGSVFLLPWGFILHLITRLVLSCNFRNGTKSLSFLNTNCTLDVPFVRIYIHEQRCDCELCLLHCYFQKCVIVNLWFPFVGFCFCFSLINIKGQSETAKIYCLVGKFEHHAWTEIYNLVIGEPPNREVTFP